MEVRSHKFKHYGWFALKVFILVWALWFLFQKIVHQDAFSLELLWRRIQGVSGSYLFLLLGMTAANWALEIVKWQRLVSWMVPLSFRESLQQSLAALTVSLPTPSRLGDYGAKAFFFSAKYRKKIVFLNFLGHAAQMSATLFFGILGWVLLPLEDLSLPILPVFWVGLGLLVLGVVVLFNSRKHLKIVKGWRFDKVVRFFKKIPARVKWVTLLYSFIRYLIFSVMFFVALQFFGAGITGWHAFPAIGVIYLLTSIIPTFVIWDVVVKGGIAVWLFGWFGVPEMIVLTTVFTMWLFNMALPALLGSFYVFKTPLK